MVRCRSVIVRHQSTIVRHRAAINRPGLTESERGRFVDEKGNFIAWHEGYPFYTIGQRRGLGIHLNRPVFVKEIDPEKNEVMLASLSSLEKTEMWLKDWNLVNQERTLGRSDIIVKIRYRKAGKLWHDYRHIGSFTARAAP